MSPPVAVNGPTVAGLEGTTRVIPEDGTGLGIGTSKGMPPREIDEGVAPAASTVVDMVPERVKLPRAAAAEAIEDGIGTCI